MNILRKHLTAIALGLCVLEIAGALLVARPQAALADTAPTAPLGTCTLTGGFIKVKLTQEDCTGEHGSWVADTNGATGTSFITQQANSSSCSAFNPLACLSDIVFLIPGYVASYLVMPLMSLLVYLSGILLNWSMEYSVVHMTVHYNETGVDYIWSVIRDLANMGFIFMLLYTAIKAIFDRSQVKRTIINLVIAAILINFSLLITKAVVDMSNVLAMLFYNAIVPQGTTTTTGLGAAFMQVLNLQSLYNLSSAAEGTKMAIVGVAGSAIYLIASFTFLAVAVMFIIRFVALVFVIALSPIYAIGKVLPNASGYAKEWEKALINQSFFAPVYFALTWVALKVAEGLLAGYTTANGTLNYSAAILGQTSGNTVKANPGAVGVFMMFAIIIGLLIAALTIAKGMATKAHPMLASAINKATGYAGGVTFGLAGGLGRNTVGRAGAMLGDNDKLKEKAAAGSISARLALAAGRRTSEQSFDARGRFGLGKTLGAGEVDKNAKGGYKKVSEEAAKDEAKRVKSYMMSKDDPRFKADQEARKNAAKAAEKALDTRTKEVTEAAKKAHPDAVKTEELIAAEEAERTAESLASKPLGINEDPSVRVQRQKAAADAKATADELRRQHAAENGRIEEARKAYIKEQAEAAQKEKDEADRRAKGNINTDRTEAAVKDAREGSYRTGTKFVPNNKEGEDLEPGVAPFIKRLVHLSDNAKAAAIRKQMKEKTPDEKLAEWAAEKAKADAAKKKEEEGETEATPEDKNT